MKTLKVLLLALPIFFFGCNNDDNEKTEPVFPDAIIEKTFSDLPNWNGNSESAIIQSQKELDKLLSNYALRQYKETTGIDLMEIDFSQYTLLVKRSSTPTQIWATEQSFAKESTSSYIYSIKLQVGTTQNADDFRGGILVKKLPSEAVISFDVEEEATQDAVIVEKYPDLPYWQIESESLIIQSKEELYDAYWEVLLLGLKNNRNINLIDIDFEKHALLLTRGGVETGIGEIKQFFSRENKLTYIYLTEIRKDKTQRPTPFVCGILIEKLAEDAEIIFQIKTTG